MHISWNFSVYVTVEAKEDHKEQNRQHLMALEGLTVHYKVLLYNGQIIHTHSS